MSLSVKKLIGPHIVAAGTETLSGTTGTIEVPAIASSVSGYFVMLQTNSANCGLCLDGIGCDGQRDWSFGVTAAS
jgi:hypothetical protein